MHGQKNIDICLVVLIVYLHNTNYFGSFNIPFNKLDTLKKDRAEHIPE